MSLLNEIRQQPKHLRMFMFALSVVTSVSLVGLLWFNSFQKNLYALLNPPEDANADQVALEKPKSPFTLLKDAVANTAASLVNIFQRNEGTDIQSQFAPEKSVAPRALPQSENR